MPTTSKPWFRSLTFWSLIATLIGIVLAGIGQGASPVSILGDPEVQATLGKILALLGFGGALIGRTRAVGPLTLGSGKGDQSGRAAVGLLAMLAVAGVLLLGSLLAGCLARQVHAERSIGVDIRRGPPCVVVITADGDVASTVTGPRCDGLPELAAPAPAVTP